MMGVFGSLHLLTGHVSNCQWGAQNKICLAELLTARHMY